MNIYSLVIRAKPEDLAAIKLAISDIAGAEIHQEHEGRLIVTVEDVPGVRTSDSLTLIQQIEGILSATLVYEYCDEMTEPDRNGAAA